MVLNQIHTAEQSHGKIIEDQIKAAFPGSSDHKRALDSKFDVEAKFDKIHNLPTSIKTTNGKTICLADARRIWSIEEDFRLIVVNYIQRSEYKIPIQLIEFLITKDEWNKIKGTIPLKEIEDFHNKIVGFGFGLHKEAREFSKAEKKRLSVVYSSSIMLNPKIDSKSQRRLQASINIDLLRKSVKTFNTLTLNEINSLSYRGLSIGPVESPARNVRKERKSNNLGNTSSAVTSPETNTKRKPPEQLDLFLD